MTDEQITEKLEIAAFIVCLVMALVFAVVCGAVYGEWLRGLAWRTI